MTEVTPDPNAEARFARLVSVVRHELLGPLNIVRSFAELLPTDDPEQEGEALQAIQRNAQLATMLVNRLRDADQIVEGSDLQLDRADTDVVELVNETMADVRHTLLANHDPTLELPDHPVIAPVDADRIRQVLLNLLSNAAKYSAPGSVVVLAVQPGDGTVQIWVTDEGEGIAPEDIDEAFTAFSRLSDSAQGTGLGLAISRVIARAHGGELTAQSAPDGPGSRFILELPVG